jgi:hypothetical protein
MVTVIVSFWPGRTSNWGRPDAFCRPGFFPFTVAVHPTGAAGWESGATVDTVPGRAARRAGT